MHGQKTSKQEYIMLISPSFKAIEFVILYCTVRKLQGFKNYFSL